jgi:SAM-dependent methyltransferase
VPWYIDYFDEDYFVGREPSLDPARTNQEADFIVERLGLSSGQSVLDLCCGQGRHCVELARRGLKLTGLDLSDYLLGLAKQAAGEAGVSVDFIRSDMRDIPFDSCFDGVINMFTAFGYLESDEEDAKALRAAARALKPGGGFLLDTVNREWLVRNFRPSDWFEHSSGRLVLSESKLDLTKGRIHAKETLIRADGTRRSRENIVRLYSYTELAAMMHAVGLEVEAVWGGFDGSDYNMDSRRMIMLARRLRGG